MISLSDVLNLNNEELKDVKEQCCRKRTDWKPFSSSQHGESVISWRYDCDQICIATRLQHTWMQLRLLHQVLECLCRLIIVKSFIICYVGTPWSRAESCTKNGLVRVRLLYTNLLWYPWRSLADFLLCFAVFQRSSKHRWFCCVADFHKCGSGPASL